MKKSSFRIIFGLFCWSIFLWPALVRGFEYQMKHWESENGLSSTFIYDLEQDQFGYLWIAGSEGLMRFDGQSFEQFPTHDSLSNSFVTKLAIGADGNLWIGHFTGELIKYDGETFSRFSSKKGKIIAILINENNLPIVVRQKGIEWYESEQQAKFVALIDSWGSVNAAAYIDEQLWLATQKGLQTFSLSEMEMGLSEGSRSNALTSLLKIGRHHLISSSPEGKLYLHRIEAQSIAELDSLQLEGDISIHAYTKVDSSSFWVSTNEGVFLLRIQEDQLIIQQRISTERGLPTNDVQCSLIDDEGNLWLGTYGRGLVGIPSNQFHFFNASARQVHSIAKYNHQLFAGQESGLLALKLNLPSNELQKVEGFEGEVTALASSEQGLYVVQNGNTIKKYQLDNWQSLNFNAAQEIKKVFVTTQGLLWVTTYHEGVFLFDPKTEQVLQQITTAEGLLNNEVLQVVQQGEDEFWFSSHGSGLARLKGNEFQYYVGKDGLSNQNINHIFLDREYTLWVATDGGGLFYFKGERFHQLNKDDGMISNFCRSIIDDEKGNIWVGAQKGLTVLDPFTKKVIKRYYFEHAKWQVVKDAVLRIDEQLFWGTAEGLLSYKPEKEFQAVVSPLQLSIERQGHQLIERDTVLGYNSYDLNFIFKQVSLANANAIEYRYFLEGYDEDWSSLTKEEKVRYRKIEEGDYTFRVFSYSDGQRIQESAIHFTVRTPFWKTLWFYPLCILLLVSAFTIIYNVRTKALRLAKIRLERIVTDRTLELKDKNLELESINKDITDSILYARRIQQAIIPREQKMRTHLPESFVLFCPKDIVSGDFYWIDTVDDKVVVTAVDCTGHGVPGAFMSMVGYNGLNKIVREEKETDPAQILEKLNLFVSDALNRSEEGQDISDGMDMAICTLDRKAMKLHYAGAMNPLYMIRAGEFAEIKATKRPIGSDSLGRKLPYETHELSIQESDRFYIFSDGFADQFGGEHGKKLKTSVFKRLLAENSQMPIQEQGDFLLKTISDWKGEREQVDDICVIGFSA